MHGFGLPGEDMFMRKGKVMYGKIRKKWICLVCHYERGKYGRHQVFGHVAAEHGYPSGIKNDRWDIPEGERHKEIKEIIRPGNIDMYMAHEISYGSIALEVTGEALIPKCLKMYKTTNIARYETDIDKKSSSTCTWNFLQVGG